MRLTFVAVACLSWSYLQITNATKNSWTAVETNTCDGKECCEKCCRDLARTANEAGLEVDFSKESCFQGCGGSLSDCESASSLQACVLGIAFQDSSTVPISSATGDFAACCFREAPFFLLIDDSLHAECPSELAISPSVSSPPFPNTESPSPTASPAVPEESGDGLLGDDLEVIIAAAGVSGVLVLVLVIFMVRQRLQGVNRGNQTVIHHHHYYNSNARSEGSSAFKFPRPGSFSAKSRHGSFAKSARKSTVVSFEEIGEPVNVRQVDLLEEMNRASNRMSSYVVPSL